MPQPPRSARIVLGHSGLGRLRLSLAATTYRATALSVASRLDEDGYRIIGRIDDVINVSGHQLLGAEVEEALLAHETVFEAAVVPDADEDTGQAIVAFVTLKHSWVGDDSIVTELREHVTARIGELARPERIIFVDYLPRTRSGKIVHRILSDVINSREIGQTLTLQDPDVVAQLATRAAGWPQD